MKINVKLALLLSTAIVAAGVGLSMATGFWSTESSKTPGKLSQSSSRSTASTQNDVSSSLDNATGSNAANTTESKMDNDPADIKGSFTFKEISSLYQIPLAELAKAFRLTESQSQTLQCKDLGSLFEEAPNEIGTASMRMFVSFYHGIDYSSTEEVYLPREALEILKKSPNIKPEQLTAAEKNLVE